MIRQYLIWPFGLFSFALALYGAPQTAARLETKDTIAQLEAGSNAPRLSELQLPGQPAWTNRASETLIDHVLADGEKIPVQWQFNSDASQVAAKRTAFVYESRAPHLRLTWEWQARAAFGPVEHQIRIQNLDSKELWLPLQDSFRFDYKAPAGMALEHWYVEKGAGAPSDAGTHQQAVRDGYSWQGTSSTYAHPAKNEPREVIPWMLIERAGGNHSGWYAGIEFSGRTMLSLQRKADSVRGAAGLNPDPGPFRTRLAPGETFETPVVFVGTFQGGADGAGNVLRRWVRQVLNRSQTWQNPNYPLMVNNSWGSGMAVDDTLARRMIRESAELGLEMFHIDAGWFRGVGDWYPDPKKFPQGLAAVADEAHRAGLKFGLWVDWTQAGLDTASGALNARDPKVRNWMVSDVPWDWKPEPFKGQTIDLGAPEAHVWAQREVERIVSDYHLDMLEHDGYLVAQGCDRTNHPHAPPDPTRLCVRKEGGSFWVDSANSTDVSYHAVRAYYDIYSKLREKHPDILLEACNDGGRMVDFGTAAHTDYFSITDTYDPLSNRRAFYDTSHLLPPAMLESYVEKWPAPRMENFLYMLRSGMMGWVTIMLDTNSWSPEQHVVAKREFELYKNKLRPLIRDADLYHISARPDGLHWDGIEYFDAQRRSGAVYAFHGSSSDEPQHAFVLKGLDPAATYHVQFQDHTSPDQTVTGRQLLASGVRVRLPQPNSSELILIDEARSK
jgi:hypothetical protein